MTSVDTEQPSPESRRAAMAVLAQSDGARLHDALARLPSAPAYEVLRAPESGLVMLRGRTGGGGAPFNLGEASVTRASVRLASGEVGHAYVLGRDHTQAELAALFDALWQREPERIEREVIAPLRAAQEAADAQRRAETAATKVNFFTLAREHE